MEFSKEVGWPLNGLANVTLGDPLDMIPFLPKRTKKAVKKKLESFSILEYDNT